MTARLLSLVAPAFKSVPKYRRTLGPEVGELAALAGLPPDPEQQLVLDATFALNAHGTLAAFEVGVICCRQNLKTGVFKQAELGWLFVTDEPLVVHSAHEFPTSQEAFRDLEQLIENCDSLRRRVKRISRGNGDEAIELLSGSRIIYKTRTKGGGRGLSGSKVVLDEGFALRAMHMGALLPTLSAQPDPQVLYGSSAGLAESAVLRRVRDRGRAGRDPRLAYFEWCAPDPEEVCAAGEECMHAFGVDGCGCDDPENWQRANPALGKRITIEYIASERRALPPEEFGRERMGWWDAPGPDETSPIPEAAWEACAIGPAKDVSRPSFALDVTLDRTRAWIGLATMRGDGRVQLEVLDSKPGVSWAVPRLVELAKQWHVRTVSLDKNGPAGALIPDLEEQRLTVNALPREEVVRACGDLVDAVNDGDVVHLDDPILNSAVASAQLRAGEATVFTRKGGGDISPLYAVTIARWALLTTPEGAVSVFFFDELDETRTLDELDELAVDAREERLRELAELLRASDRGEAAPKAKVDAWDNDLFDHVSHFVDEEV